MIDDLLDFFPHVVSHSPAVAYNGYGEPEHDLDQHVYRARIIYRRRRVPDRTGNLVLSRGEVWIAGIPVIGFDDLLTLPDETTPAILAVDALSDNAGLHHTKVYFG